MRFMQFHIYQKFASEKAILVSTYSPIICDLLKMVRYLATNMPSKDGNQFLSSCALCRERSLLKRVDYKINQYS